MWMAIVYFGGFVVLLGVVGRDWDQEREAGEVNITLLDIGSTVCDSCWVKWNYEDSYFIWENMTYIRLVKFPWLTFSQAKIKYI